MIFMSEFREKEREKRERERRRKERKRERTRKERENYCSGNIVSLAELRKRSDILLIAVKLGIVARQVNGIGAAGHYQ